VATLTAKGACAALCVLVLAGCSSQGHKSVPNHFAKRVRVAPDVRLWIECSGSGPVVLADGGLGIPTRAWVDVRNQMLHVRFCAFDRAGVGRSEVRPCRCGTLKQNVEDIHALIRAAGLSRPVILAGHSTGGLDSLLYARKYRSDIDGLVLVDSPSESAPVPPTALEDGRTRLDFRSGLAKLRRASDLGDLPILVLSHGRRTFSTRAAERSWTTMQRELAEDSSNTLRVVALDSRHLIQDDQPRLVAAALDEAGAFFPKKQRLRCLRSFAARHGRCAPGSP
jgi:pimeloyl-ACP methyl ester carboxylesterase